MSNTKHLDSKLALGVDLASPTAEGHWVSDKIHHIVELLYMYDSSIEVQWIPPDQRLTGDPEFRLLDCSPNRPPYIIFHVRANEFDERVLARVIESDQAKQGLKLSSIDAHNDAIRLMKAKRQADEAQDKADLVKHILKSPKARYRHDGVVYE